MDPIIGGALISAGSSLAGSAINAFGGGNNHAGRDARQAVSYANRSAILDRVAAAKQAGISPLYALGAPTGAFQSWAGGDGGNAGMGDALSQMGADVGRAVAAKQTDMERAIQALTLDKAGLENDYLREQIASIRARTIRESAPPLPSAGLVPSKRVPPQITTGVNIGTGFETNPYFSDAQTYEDRYGELGGSMLGLINIPADAYHNIPKPSMPSTPQYWRNWDEYFGG